MTETTPGVCRHCRCAEATPCGYCKGIFGGCTWTNADRIVCCAPACIRAEGKRRKPAAPERKQSRYAELAARGWGLGAIRGELDRERKAARRGKRRKGRAA